MIPIEFAHNAKKILEPDENVIGLAAGGSWLTGQLDEFSDLDLILVTRERISGDKTKMLAYAEKLGNFFSGFTGEAIDFAKRIWTSPRNSPAGHFQKSVSQKNKRLKYL